MSDEKENNQQHDGGTCVVCKAPASAPELDTNSGLCFECWSEYYNH